jgi:urease accessory protein
MSVDRGTSYVRSGVAAASLPSTPRGGPGDSRHAEASLRFVKSGARTVISRQYVPYPFHITRPFYLDDARPDLATIYLQSASGGIFRGDSLGMTIEVASGAAVHITTQSETVVHNTYDEPATQHLHVTLGDGAFAAYVPDLLVLFPGVSCISETTIVVAEGARMVICEGHSAHDPADSGGIFNSIMSTTIVRNVRGETLVEDRQQLSGRDLLSAASPLGGYRVTASVFLIGRTSAAVDYAALEQSLDQQACWCGATPLPTDAGLAIRVVARSGGDLTRGLKTAAESLIEQAIGVRLAPRRK